MGKQSRAQSTKAAVEKGVERGGKRGAKVCTVEMEYDVFKCCPRLKKHMLIIFSGVAH